jgi:outer membrane protein insertion porin family
MFTGTASRQGVRLTMANRWLTPLLALLLGSGASHALAQLGGGGMGGMGGGGGGGGAPSAPGLEKPKFRDHLYQQGGPAISGSTDNRLVLGVEIAGQRQIDTERIRAAITIQPDERFDDEQVLADVRAIRNLGYFSDVSYKIIERPEGVIVRFIVRERPLISSVYYHGNYALEDRMLKTQAAINAGDPLSEFAIESARTRLVEFYRQKGFNQAVIDAQVGVNEEPQALVFRINEGELQRIRDISIVGSTIVSPQRLKKIIGSREGFLRYWGNRADLELIEEDREKLTRYYRDLGFLDARIGHQLQIDPSGKWIDLVFAVEEGQRYGVRNVTVVGNRYFTTDSLQQQLKLLTGEHFDRGKLERDARTLLDSYGEQGFIYADVEPNIHYLDEPGQVDLVYRIEEGARYRCSEIRVHLDGDSQHTKEHVLLNLVEIRPGEIYNRTKLVRSERRLAASQYFEVNPQMAEPPRIAVSPPESEDTKSR